MENSSTAGGRRRGTTKHSAEDQALDQIAKEAEARLAARRQARAEAREIRMRELERQQKEADENADRLYDMHPETALRTPPARSVSQSRTPVVNNSGSSGGSGGSNHQWSRRSSEDSLEDERNDRDGRSARDLRMELKEIEDKFRKAMIQNAQLDNEKASYTYQVELLKDKVEDLEVAYAQLQRENREKCREADQLKRLVQRMKDDLDMCRAALEERDRLIQEQGLVIVGDEGELDNCEDGEKQIPRKALVSVESAEMLQKAGEGSLDVRLRKLAEERNELLDQIRHVKLELEEERSRHRNGPRTLNGPADSDMEDLQREAQKLLGDYKFRLQKAEQDVSTLQANVARLESQVIRYKSAAETAEKVEDELKVEKRKLQREAVYGSEDFNSMNESNESHFTYGSSIFKESEIKLMWEGYENTKPHGRTQLMEVQDEVNNNEENFVEGAELYKTGLVNDGEEVEQNQVDKNDRRKEEVNENDEECLEKEEEEKGDQIEEEDFWAVLSGGAGDKIVNKEYSQSSPSAILNDQFHSELCESRSFMIPPLFIEPANGSEDTSSFEPVTTLCEGGNSDVNVDFVESTAADEEEVDFWAELKEVEEQPLSHNSSESEEPASTSSSLFLVSHNVSNSPLPAQNFQENSKVEMENDEVMDVLDYLDGVFMWEETDFGSGPEAFDSADKLDVADYLDGITMWELSPSVENACSDLSLGEPDSFLQSTLHDCVNSHPSNQGSYYFLKAVGCSKSDDLMFGVEDNKSKLHFAQDVLCENQDSNYEQKLADSDGEMALGNEIQIIEHAADKALTGSTRIPRPSLIPKPKKHALPRPKSDPVDLTSRNLATDALDRKAAQGSARQCCQRRRGRGFGNRWRTQKN